ncbi:MAG: sensor histidine kinase, partial [Longicatena sp.]
VNKQIIIIIETLVILLSSVSLAIEYGRRAAFYHTLEQTLTSLDKKYLLSEVIEEPSFMDGKIFFETLRVVDKSMAEHVNTYRLSQNEYKNYIEMWVHEVKTPLAAAKLIIENNPSTTSTSISEEVEKIEGFVEQALYYARSTNPEKDYLIKMIELKPILSKTIKKHAKEFIYRKIKITLDNLDVQVYSDSKWLEFILEQILNNALKYTPEECGEIHIYTTTKENSISLHIQDNGIGIDISDLPRIFEKGFTGRNGRLNEKATGMGLYICKTLCDKLYLELNATSIVNQGTCITIVFPISKMMLLK